MPRSLFVFALFAPFVTAGLLAAESPAPATSLPQPEMFGTVCAVCHGGDGSGTDRAPGLLNNRRLRTQSESDIAGVIRNGRNNMPSFAGIPDEQIQALAAYVHSLNASAIDMNPPGDAVSGSKIFFGSGQCAQCHTAEGRGGANGPDLSSIGRQLTLKDLTQAIDHPPSRVVAGYARVRVTLRDGSVLQGFARNQATHALVLQTTDGRLHLLRDTDYTSVVTDTSPYAPVFKGNETERRDLIAYVSRLGGVSVGPNVAAREPVAPEIMNAVLNPKPGDWASYNGRLDGNRYSELTTINTQNVAQLRSEWVHPLPYSPLETTPIVIDGVMYVTGPNQVYALDGRSGSEIWSYSRPRSSAEGISGDASKGANREIGRAHV